jgi:threonylcarbamoyladenosine tRNA methylthiotransferase MtaB
MNKKRIAFHTLGCKLNFAETSNLARELQEDCQLVDFTEEADYYVLQSCAVTATAEKKCRSAIRKAHRTNPAASIVVIGCMSQLRADQLAEMDGVSMVLGNSEKFQLKSLIKNGTQESIEKIRVDDILKDKTFHPSYSGSDRTRTFVKIQDGCDYFCSFCTIPLARGRSRSNSIESTMNLIKTALNEQPRELVLTGVNIGDFGKPNDETLTELLCEIETLETSVRFRLSSIEPDLLNDALIDLVAQSKKFMPHFHIPLQSGSNTVLKRMNRRYYADTFESRVLRIKNRMPQACIAADVIVGFPVESDEEFRETFSLIKKLPLSYLHVFPYSERPGTRAMRMDDKVSPRIIQQRVAELLKLSEAKKRKFLHDNTGITEEVLFESVNDNGFISGFTRNYIRVKAPYNMDYVNCVIKTLLNSMDDDGTYFYEPIT